MKPVRWGPGVLGLLMAAPLHAGVSWDAYRLYLRGLLELRERRPQAAAPLFEEVLKKDPDAADAARALAEAHLAAGRPDKALPAAERLTALAGDTAAAHVLLGRVYLALGRRAAAQEAFDRALKIDPASLEALGWSTDNRALSDPAVARRALERFLEQNVDAPGTGAVRSRLTELLQQQGDGAGAEAAWKKFIRSNPDNPEARLGLAGLYDLRGDAAAAAEAYEDYLRLSPDAPDVLARLGQIYFETGRVDRAGEVLDRADRLQPGDPGLSFWRALVAESESRWADAARLMSLTARVSPQPGVLLRLAAYQQRLERPRETLKTLHRLLRLQPENPDFLAYLAQAYEDAGRPRAAIRAFTRVLKKDPRRADAEFHVALNWDRLHRFDRAEPHLRRVLALDPGHHPALNYLGYSWVDRGIHLEEGLALIQRAVALEPENPAYRDSLGWAYFRLGRWPEAETALAASVHPAEDPLVWAHYGDVLAARGRGDEAVRAWQEGLLLDPKSRPLLKKLGVDGALTNVSPRTAARTLLKRVEGNFRQLRGLTAFAEVEGRWGGRAFAARGVWHYASPERMRLDVLGPLLAPVMIMIHTSSGTRWFPPEAGAPEAEPWLRVLAGVLDGTHFKSFDDPAVAVRFDGGRLIYDAPFGTLAIEGRGKTLAEATLPGPAGPVRLVLGGYRELEGVQVPLTVRVETPDGRLSLTFSHAVVNPPEDPRLFHPPAQP